MPAMKTACPCLYFLPAGPGTQVPFLLDTLESIRTFAIPGHHILLVDDSAEGIGEQAKRELPDLNLLVTRPQGADDTRSVSGKFFETVAKGMRHATAEFEFDVLIRMDADALMTNPGADRRAIDYFRSNPTVGMIGSHRVRCDGQPRDFKRNAEIIENECRWSFSAGRRSLARSYKSLLGPAVANGYELGENVIGPGATLSKRACEALSAHPLFGDASFRFTKLGDDHLNSLLLRALGFGLDDFATGDLPLGVWLRKLEWSPEELVKRGKCIVHSVRGYQDLGEAQVRERFRILRQQSIHPASQA